MASFGYLATFFTFAALILQAFSMLGATYSVPFLRDLFFAKIEISDEFILFGLWSYCSGTISNGVQTCSTPVAAFDWSKVTELSRYVADLHNMEKLFLANFILYWIATGFTAIALVVTVMTSFRRGPDFLASVMTFIAFVIMLIVFVIVLVISIRGINTAKGVDSSVHGVLGPATWMTLGAFVSLLFSSVGYCFACICGPGKVRSEKA